MDENLHEIRQSYTDRLQNIFFACLACFCFCLGSYYWIRLVGVIEGENWRFDLMNWQWRSLSCALAILYPVASCGVWLHSRWGVVLWLTGAVIEIFCYLVFLNLFALNLWLALMHLIFLGCYLALLFYQRRITAMDKQDLAQY